MSTRKLLVLTGVLVSVAVVGVLGSREVARIRVELASPAGRLRDDLKHTRDADGQPLFARYLTELDPKGILEVLEKEYPYCHSQAHPLGKALYARGHDLHESLETCGNRCTGGCFHGVITEALRQFAATIGAADAPATLDQLLAHGRRLCDDPDPSLAARRGSCAHGVGHAFAFMTQSRMAQAIDGCRTFSERMLQFHCARGAYMERDMAQGPGDVVADYPMKPCLEEIEFPAACYRYKVPRLFQRGLTLDRVVKMCLDLTGFQELGCFHGLGFAQLETIGRFPEALAIVCTHGTRDDQRVCIDGAAEKLSDFSAKDAQAACASLHAGRRPTLATALG